MRLLLLSLMFFHDDDDDAVDDDVDDVRNSCYERHLYEHMRVDAQVGVSRCRDFLPVK